MTPAEEERRLAALVDAMRGLTVEGIRVHDALAEVVYVHGDEPILRLILQLDDPGRDAETWSVEVAAEIRSEAFRAVYELGLPDWLRVVFRSRSESAELFARAPER